MTYADVGGCKEQIDKLREVVETPLLHVCFISQYFEGSMAVLISSKVSQLHTICVQNI